MNEYLGLDCIPKMTWEFFFGWNIAKPLRDLIYGYVPEGYDQQAEEEAYRNRQRSHLVIAGDGVILEAEEK